MKTQPMKTEHKHFGLKSFYPHVCYITPRGEGRMMGREVTSGHDTRLRLLAQCNEGLFKPVDCAYSAVPGELQKKR